MSYLRRLKEAGFDLSEVRMGPRWRWRVRCSQCEALVVNGTPTHETGCPNGRRTAEEAHELDEWDEGGEA